MADKIIQLKDKDNNNLYPSILGDSIPDNGIEPSKLSKSVHDKINEAVTNALSNYKSVEVVNDLTTGGTDKALSAEMGKKLQDVSKEHKERIETLEDKENELIAAVGTGGSVDTRITNAVNVEKTRAEGAESTLDGKITAEQTRAANAENALDGRVDTLEEAVGTGGSVDSKIASAVATETSRAQEAEANRYTKNETYTREEVNNLITTPNQEYVSVTATDQTTAVTDVLPAIGLANTVYRVGSWDGSQYDVTKYSEYAWNGKDYVHLSTKTGEASAASDVTYNHNDSKLDATNVQQAVDELALGAVYDVSAKNPTAGVNNDGKWESLSALLSDTNLNTLIPTAVRKGGMSIKFVQSSDNSYYQYRYKLEYEDTIAGNEAFKNPENWAIEDDGVYTDNPEFLFALIDSLNNLLFWIRKKDGGIDWAVGVPKPVKNYINAKVNELWNGNNEIDIDGLNKVIAFLNDYNTSNTLKGLLNEKVDKVNNKSLIDEIVANLNYSGDNPEFKYLAKHLNETIAFGVKKDGTFFWTKGIPEHLVKYIKEQINKKPIHLTKPTSDNLCAFKCSDIETNWKGLNTMLFLEVKPGRPYYNNLSKYIEVLNSYNPSIVRTITWQYDITNPDVISQYDTVLYYIAKENKEILLTTNMIASSDYKNITDWEPIFANIEFLARRYNGENLIYPADDAEAEGLPVFVKYWEFNNEMNYKLSSTAQVKVQKRFYNLIKSINSSFKVMSLGYSDGTDKLVLTNQEYVNSYDIYNFHTYRFNLKDFISNIQERLEANNYALDKEFWLTEYGPNMLDNSSSLSETFMANCVAIESLVALSFGASKCLYWANEYLVSNINPIEYYDTYNSLMFLYSIHGEGATKPILKENGGIYSLRWNFNNKVYTALYADKAINVDVVFNQSATVYNYLGIQKEHKITQVDNNIIYIENSDNIIINLK